MTFTLAGQYTVVNHKGMFEGLFGSEIAAVDYALFMVFEFGEPFTVLEEHDRMIVTISPKKKAAK